MSAPSKFYNLSKILSYNAAYNMCVGGRGIGKTYGFKKKGIRDAIVKGDEFIYLRRYKTELQTARNTFFADVGNEFPNHDFRLNGWLAQASLIADRDAGKKREWITLGYFIALSQAQNIKSVAFPKVKTIIFDEFIIEKGALHYLPDEAVIFNNFYSTVDRYKDKTRAFFLANSVSIMNPYFLEYEIRPDQSSEFVIKAGGFLVCHFINSDEFANEVYQTKFGKFIKDTDYADYAVGNAFDDNHESLLALKNPKARYLFTLECKTGSFSVWHDIYTDDYFIQSKRPKAEMIFTLLSERMAEDKKLMSFTDKPLAYLRAGFRAGRVSFDKPSTRNTFADIFKR